MIVVCVSQLPIKTILVKETWTLLLLQVALSKFFQRTEHKQKLNNSFIKPVMYVVTSIKTPVGCKTIPYLCGSCVAFFDEQEQ